MIFYWRQFILFVILLFSLVLYGYPCEQLRTRECSKGIVLQSLNYPKPESKKKWFSKTSNWFEYFETESGKSNSLFLQRTYLKSWLIGWESGEWGRRSQVCRLGRGLRLTRLYLLYLWLYIGYRLYLHFITIGKSDFVEGGGSEAVAASGVGMSGKQNRGPIQILIVEGGGSKGFGWGRVEKRWKLLYLYTSGEVRNRGLSPNLSKVIHLRKNIFLGIELLVVVHWQIFNMLDSEQRDIFLIQFNKIVFFQIGWRFK